ncbi:MAG: hypothetical protein J6Z14_08755 [Prevotella sp.]|nr:hypothetical protein [Prevotella sp.]
MKKLMMTTIVLLAALVVQAEDFAYPYLTFQTADGKKQSAPVSLLVMTVVGDQLVLQNPIGSATFPLASLSKMYFSQTEAGSTVTAVSSPSQAEGAVQVYTPSGIFVGNYASLAKAKGSLARGIYVIKTENATFKTTVK